MIVSIICKRNELCLKESNVLKHKATNRVLTLILNKNGRKYTF